MFGKWCETKLDKKNLLPLYRENLFRNHEIIKKQVCLFNEQSVDKTNTNNCIWLFVDEEQQTDGYGKKSEHATLFLQSNKFEYL